MNAYIRKGRSTVNNQNFHFMKLEKEQIKSKVNKIKEIKINWKIRNQERKPTKPKTGSLKRSVKSIRL